MRNILLTLFVVLCFSCSKEESGGESNATTPETFTVRYEILGSGEVPLITYTSNEGPIEVETDEGEEIWDVSGVTLPFIKEFVYTTKIDGTEDSSGATVHGCSGVGISVYANRNDGQIKEMNIYINGELKETETEGYYYAPGEHWTPWGSASYSYLMRGADDKYTCVN